MSDCSAACEGAGATELDDAIARVRHDISAHVNTSTRYDYLNINSDKADQFLKDLRLIIGSLPGGDL